MSETESPRHQAGSRLLQEFSPHGYAEWKEAAEALLKGAPFEKRLRTPTWEGFTLEPIYNASDVKDLPHLQSAFPGLGNRARGNNPDGYRTTSWAISQELIAGTPQALNQIALEALTTGQNELNLWFDAATRGGIDADDPSARGVGMCGVSLNALSDAEAILDGVHLEAISSYLRTGAFPLAVAVLYLAAARTKGIPINQVHGCIEADPAGYLVSEGSLPRSWQSAFDEMAALTRFAQDNAPGLQTVAVQGHPYHDGGASSAEELGAVLATGVEYLRALTERGITPEAAAPHFRLSVSIGSQSFLEIAKLRALRLLWSRVLEAFGVAPEKRRVHVHARTGLWNKTRLDPYVNMLRTTTEAFSAVVGGVDSLHVGPFDEVIREPNTFSRRIARNTHHILAEECDLTKVADPAGGSWAVERLTHELAEQAWKQFQQIEELGGIKAALESGAVQKRIAKTLADRRMAIAQRREVIVGTNNYPNSIETPLEPAPVDVAGRRDQLAKAVQAHRGARNEASVTQALKAFGSAEQTSADRVLTGIEAAAAGATLADLAGARPSVNELPRATAIPFSRAAAEYEKLVDDIKALGTEGRIRQVNLGPSRRYRLRADWTSAFFRVGGFNVLSDDDYESIDAAVEALQADPTPVAVITSDDETYAAEATQLASRLKAAQPSLRLFLAGAPGEKESEWRAAGIEDFVNVRVNNYAFNSALAKSLAE